MFDPTYPKIGHNDFPRNDWSRFYGYIKEPTLPNAPKPRGKPVILQTFVDADHAGKTLTQ